MSDIPMKSRPPGDFGRIVEKVDALTKGEVLPPKVVDKPEPSRYTNTAALVGNEKKHGAHKSVLDIALGKALARTEKNGRTVAYNLVEVMINTAKKGNVSMMKLIVERNGGLPTQRIEQDSELRIVVERIGS